MQGIPPDTRRQAMGKWPGEMPMESSMGEWRGEMPMGKQLGRTPIGRMQLCGYFEIFQHLAKFSVIGHFEIFLDLAYFSTRPPMGRSRGESRFGGHLADFPFDRPMGESLGDSRLARVRRLANASSRKWSASGSQIPDRAYSCSPAPPTHCTLR